MTTHLPDDLRALMDSALADIDVPVHRLHDRAVTAGRRVRRRRRTVALTGGLAAVAAVVALVVPLTGGTGTTARDRGYAGEPTDLADLPQPFVHRPGFWDMPAAGMAERLAGLLPGRVTLSTYETHRTDAGPGESSAYVGDLVGTLDAPGGSGSVEVMLTQLADQAVLDAATSGGHSWGDQDFGCPPEMGPDTTIVACRTTADRSGRVFQRELEARTEGITYREARIVTGGGTVLVASANSTQAKWRPPASAPRNPLTLDQLTAIATSPTWAAWRPASPSGR